MSVYHGKSGAVDFNSATLGNVTEWTYEEATDEFESTAMGDTAKSYIGGLTDGSGTVTCWWDSADTGQTELTVGASATLILYPRGNTSTYQKYEGTATILSFSINSTKDSIISVTFNFRGKLTLGSVT